MYRVTQQVLDFKETFTNLFALRFRDFFLLNFCPKHAGIPGINYTYVVTLDINQMEKGESFSPKSYFFFLFFNSKWTFEKVTPLQSALKIEKESKGGEDFQVENTWSVKFSESASSFRK